MSAAIATMISALPTSVCVLAAAARLADEDEVDGRQPDGVADPVPVDRERPDRERDGVRGDVDHGDARPSVRGRAATRPRWRRRVDQRVRPYTGPRMTVSPPPRSAADAVNAEFNWWLLIVGLVLGAALTWLVMAESARRDADLTETEQRGEARWIASVLRRAGGRPRTPASRRSSASTASTSRRRRRTIRWRQPEPTTTTPSTQATATEGPTIEEVAPAERAPVTPEER